MATEETRLKAQRRGWHYDKNPGFHDLKGKFEDAERKNLASHVKLAISNAFIQKTVASSNASPERMQRFVNRMNAGANAAADKAMAAIPGSASANHALGAVEKRTTAIGTGMGKLMSTPPTPRPVVPTASSIGAKPRGLGMGGKAALGLGAAALGYGAYKHFTQPKPQVGQPIGQQKTAGIKDFLSGAVVGATYTPRTLAISTASPNKARSHFGKGWNVGHLLPYAALATGAYQLGKHLNKPKEDIQEEAVKSALAKFALLDEHGDPLGDLSKILREADFGFGGGKPQATNKMEIAPRGFFGPPAGMNSGDSASRMGGFNTGGGYTGV